MDEKKDILQEFLSGGWLILLVGATGMLVRILYSDIKYSIREDCMKIVAASLSSGLAWYILEQTDFTSFTKAICYGVVGVVSPEIISGLIKAASKLAKNPSKLLDKLK